MLPHVPGEQLSGIIALLPAGHTKPGSHGLHDAWLSSSWYEPSSQLLQSALPFAAAVPVLQLTGDSEPTTQKLPAGQVMQAAADAPPAVPRNEPASHSVTELAPAPHQPPASHTSHAVAFDDDWNSPAAHSKHVCRPLAFEKPPGAHSIGSVERATQ